MIYKSSFLDKNNKAYHLTIGDKGKVKDITLTSTPFVVTLEGDGDTVFKSVKYSKATINVWADKTMMDCLSSTPNEVKVTLTDKQGNIEWMGYVEPTMFDQPYSKEKEEITIDCIDDLATLQYYNFPYKYNYPITSFLNLMKMMLSKTRYKKLYMSEAYRDIDLTNLYISEQNFIDEKAKEDDITDNDTFKEVMEKLVKFLNMTLVPQGENLYLINYRGLKDESIKYTLYDLQNESIYYHQTLSNRTNIGKVRSGANISLSPCHSQVKVEAKVNKYEELNPDIFDNQYLTNVTAYQDKDNKELVETKYKWNNSQIFIDEDDQKGKHTVTDRFMFRFYSHSKYKCHYYDSQGNEHQEIENIDNWKDLYNYDGASIIRMRTENIEHSELYTPTEGKNNFGEYVLLGSGWNKNANKVLFETREPFHTFLTQDCKIVLNGGIEIRENKPTLPSSWKQYAKDYFHIQELYLNAVLKIGDWYFTNLDRPTSTKIRIDSWGILYELLSGGRFNRQGRWTKTPSTFKLQFSAANTNHFLGTTFNVLSTSGDKGNEGISRGYVISIPEEIANTKADIEFKLLFTRFATKSHSSRYYFLKDFSLKAQIPKDDSIKEWESDTIYKNVINANYSERGKTVKYEVNTFDNKIPSYSSVIYKDWNKMRMLDGVYSNVTKETHRMEEHYIQDSVLTYSSPNMELNCTTFEPYPIYSLLTKKIDGKPTQFIIDTYEYDYRDLSFKYKLTQLK